MSIRSFAARMIAASAVLVAFGIGGAALAQTPITPTPPAKQKQPAPAVQKQKQPPTAPIAQPTPQPEVPAQDPNVQQAAAIPTPWTRICSKDPQENKEVCLITQEIRAETGQFLASVAVREVQDDPKKQFIIAVPPGMLLQPGMRVIIDQGQPAAARYAICFPNACYGDADINADFIASMKKGQALIVQAINQVGRTVNFTLVLKDFAKAYDGPPTDPKKFEEQQKQLQEELQKRAEEARKKLEGQQAAPQPPAPAAPTR